LKSPSQRRDAVGGGHHIGALQPAVVAPLPSFLHFSW